MGISEKQLERKCCRLAEAEGWLAFKLVSPNMQGVPDRMFLKDGVALFVEFKGPNGKVSNVQWKVIGKIRRKGFIVEVVDDYDRFRKLLGLNGYATEKELAIS